MPSSMTGFGRAVHEDERARVAVTLRSVNHRGLKISARIPEVLAPLQGRFEARIRERVQRGAVHLEIRHRDLGRSSRFTIHRERLRAYVEELAEAAVAFGTEPVSLRIEEIAQLPGVVEELDGAGDECEALLGSVVPAIDKALDELVASRRREGVVLTEQIMELHDEIGARLSEISRRRPSAQREYHKRMQVRVQQLLEGTGVEVEAQVLVRELALFAERTDISEEVTRMGAHLGELARAIASEEPVGRRLEFLAQELMREANTMTSKTGDGEMAQHCLDVKVHVDRIREQVANLE